MHIKPSSRTKNVHPFFSYNIFITCSNILHRSSSLHEADLQHRSTVDLDLFGSYAFRTFVFAADHVTVTKWRSVVLN